MSEILYRVSNMTKEDIVNFVNNIITNYLSLAQKIESDKDIGIINLESIIFFEVPTESNIVHICLIKREFGAKNYVLQEIAKYNPNTKITAINESNTPDLFTGRLINKNSYRQTMIDYGVYILYNTYVINIIE